MSRSLLDVGIVMGEVLKMHFKEPAGTITASEENEDEETLLER